MRWLLCLIFVLLNFSAETLAARILVILPFPGQSHNIYSSAVLRALLQRGHEIVKYSPFPPAKPPPGYTHVEVHTAFEERLKKWTYEDFQRTSQEDQPILGVGFNAVWAMTYLLCEQTLQHENIKKLLNSDDHFDLVITESTFGQESMLVFGHRFKAPTITLQGFVLWSVLNRAAGNSLSIASIPDFASTTFTNHMTFKERAFNFLSILLTQFQFYNIHLPIHQKIVDKYYPGEAPSVEEMVTNVSLYIINSHPAVEYAQPYTPNIVPVAGITLTADRTPLPQDVQKFMDSAKDGVIYFSFGTVVPLHIFPNEILQIFVNVFKKLKQKVIWKINLDSIPGLPSNVILRKWLPQPGVLAHPNLKLFLTHGGLNSQLEAINAGVPTVGMPFFGDQPYNVRFNEHHEIGVKVDFKTLTEESLLTAINKVLKDSRYRENALRLSRIFRDRPMSPGDSVVFWTEYVLRHAGAPHLQPAAARLPWYTLWLLDVAAVAALATLTVVWVVYTVVRKILKVIFGRSVSKSKKNN